MPGYGTIDPEHLAPAIGRTIQETSILLHWSVKSRQALPPSHDFHRWVAEGWASKEPFLKAGFAHKACFSVTSSVPAHYAMSKSVKPRV